MNNPNPPLLHFGLPVTYNQLKGYIDWVTVTYNLEVFDPLTPLTKSLNCPFRIGLEMPYFTTTKCQGLITLYTNYNFEERELIDEDEEDLLQRIKMELEMDEDVSAGWYFDADDPWKPGMPE